MQQPGIRPTALPVLPNEIPAELKAVPHWVVWRYVEEVDQETGEVDWDKPPVNARTGRLASTTDPSTWCDFDTALAVYQKGGLDGIGFVLHRNPDADDSPDGIVGVDLDKCRDPQTGEIAEWARPVLQLLPTYSEVSPSGKGLRLFLLGTLPPGRRKKGTFEVYETVRYVTVTGQRLQDRPTSLVRLQAPLEQVHALFFPPVPPPQAGLPMPSWPRTADDEELIRLALAARNGEDFRRLWDGDSQAYGSHSEADLALCNHLAFWCGPGGEGRVADLFSRSGLFRAKWQRDDYRLRTVAKAYEGRTEFYEEPGRPAGNLLVVGLTPAAAFAADDGQGILLWASKVKPRKVSWLWPGRVPLGKLTTFAGIGGLGKTFVLLDMAARVSRGLPWPDSRTACAPAGKVLFLSGEDDPDDTLVPRLIEMGADLTRIAFLRMAVLDRFTLKDLVTLDLALTQAGEGVNLVVMDPPSSFLGDADEHKNAEVRGLLSPLKSWCSKHRLATILNTHLNKQAAKVEATARVMGSVAWINAVRAAHLFGRDPEDQEKVIFVPMKMNVGKPSAGWSYKIVSCGDCARVQWIEEIALSADETVSRERGVPRHVRASEWLIEKFRERREWESEDLFRAAREEGIHRDAIFEAKRKLHLPRARRNTHLDGTYVWVWWVPDNWEPLRTEEGER